ncbi:hypothetical protein CMI42_00980 [Candidatus Pacearchaeota archaeon]|nr:hypothetical protein [Candidatus Pacearchaeota archaeon]
MVKIRVAESFLIKLWKLKGEMKLVEISHAVAESSFHIQLTPTYRQDIFRDPDVRELTPAFILEKLSNL